MESAITSKGQVTIPKPIREFLRVKPGDRVKFFMHPDGTVVLLPKVPVTALVLVFVLKTIEPVWFPPDTGKQVPAVRN